VAADRKPKISIVIPAYKAEAFIEKSVAMRIAELKALGLPYELIVVIDGHSSATAAKLERIRDRHVKIFHYDRNKGKGFAVRYGMLHASGDFIGYVDAGTDIGKGNIRVMVDKMLQGGVDAVLPSKWHKDSKVVYPWLRKLFSRVYNLYLRIVLGLDVSDTQVGAKLYTARLVKKVVPRLLVKRFAFEAEFLAVAKHLGFGRFAEVPVKIRADRHSTVRIFDGLHSYWDAAAVFYRLHLKRFYDRDLNYHKGNHRRELKKLVLL
jgi:glycosyltransferase involved in cell wall biosynthesis